MKKNLIEKAMKDIVKGSKNRPILECVHFDEDGSISATDSHVLLQIRDRHQLGKDFNLNLNTFEQMTGVYPDIERLISTKSGDVSFTLNATGLDIADAFIKGLRPGVFVELISGNGEALMECGGVSCKLPVTETTGGIKIIGQTFKPALLKSALTFLKDWVRQPECVSGTAQFQVYGPLTPLQIDSYPATYKVCPHRVQPNE